MLEKLPLLLLAAILSVITYRVHSTVGSLPSLDAAPFAERIAIAVVSYAMYLWKMPWPARLALYYPLEVPLPGWQVTGAAALLVVATVLVLFAARQRPYEH